MSCCLTCKETARSSRLHREYRLHFKDILLLINSKLLLANQGDGLGIFVSGLTECVKMTGNFLPFETGFGIDAPFN